MTGLRGIGGGSGSDLSFQSDDRSGILNVNSTSNLDTGLTLTVTTTKTNEVVLLSLRANVQKTANATTNYCYFAYAIGVAAAVDISYIRDDVVNRYTQAIWTIPITLTGAAGDYTVKIQTRTDNVAGTWGLQADSLFWITKLA